MRLSVLLAAAMTVLAIAPASAADQHPVLRVMMVPSSGAQIASGSKGAGDAQAAFISRMVDRAGFEPMIVFSSLQRMHEQFIAKRSDCYLLDHELVRDEPGVKFLDTEFAIHVGVYMRAEDAASVRTKADLKNKKIGIVLASPRTARLLDGTGATIEAVPDDGQNLQKLRAARLDGWLTARASALAEEKLRQDGIVYALDLRAGTVVLMCNGSLPTETITALNHAQRDLIIDGTFASMLSGLDVTPVPFKP